MFFSIEPTNGLAIYDQITRQVKFAVANNSLEPGEMVPSVRELAKELAVNPNTVARAYRELQGDQVLAGRRGTGLEVTETAPQVCRKERQSLLAARFGSVLREAVQSGLGQAEIRKLVDAEFRRLQPQGDSA
jgi:GntR family transcriptional regulator